MTVSRFAPRDAAYVRAPGQDGDVLLGNVVDQRDGEPLSVGFGRYAPHQSNGETLAFAEAMVILEGSLTVETARASVTAVAGEIVYMSRGEAVTYRSHGDGALIAYVTHPHWQEAAS